ncbi:MAG: type I restriction endonuclease [Cyanobium sp.]
MDLIDQLKALALRAEKTGPNLTNEEATKMALIAPFIQALGYDIFNPAEVMPEFRADLPGIKQGERVDYAVIMNEKPQILIEAKPFGMDLRDAEMGQLSRYFHATEARIAILSNGRQFRFFSDLEKSNVMDTSPFAEVDLNDLANAPLEELKKLSKTLFDLESLLTTAEALKIIRAVKKELKAELLNPSDWLVKEMATRCHSAKNVTEKVKEQVKPLVIEAIKQVISDRINERLGAALQAEQNHAQSDGDQGAGEGESEGTDNGIITTEDELGGLLIIRAICSEGVDPNRLLPKDTKSYFNVLVDGNTRKPVVRFRFDGNIKRVEFCDGMEPKSEVIEGPSGLYQHQERIRKSLNAQLGSSDLIPPNIQ